MKLYRIKKSKIDNKGRGLYATRDIKAGTKIINYTGKIISSSFFGFISIISGNMPLEYVSGIVGIANVANEEAKTGGLIALISLMAFISANLGLINILPIPGLDGGHAVISIVEGLIGRELPIKVKYTIQFIGLFLILSLFIFTIFNDIRNIFN